MKFLFLEETGKFEAKSRLPQTVKATVNNPFEKGKTENAYLKWSTRVNGKDVNQQHGMEVSIHDFAKVQAPQNHLKLLLYTSQVSQGQDCTHFYKILKLKKLYYTSGKYGIVLLFASFILHDRGTNRGQISHKPCKKLFPLQQLQDPQYCYQ